MQFKTSDAGLEDSLLTILLKISDLSNGCDTVLKRQVFIYPTVTADFTIPAKVCIGDTARFVNTSKYKSGYVENWWSYGTGDPNDTSNLVDGEFIFKKAGTYTVKLRGTTNPYGFVFEKSVPVVVNEIPKAAFTRQNACVGESVKFVNQTTPTTAKMYWDFGDGKGFVLNNATNISLNYGAAGTYVVTLIADISGCEATETQKVYQFVVPKASFTPLSGRCDGDAFAFQNNSSIATGSFGSKWFFNHPDSSSNDPNPKYIFNTPGSKSVKLVVKSEFGCKDSQTRTVTVFESPKVAFKYDAACIRTSTQFTNQTPAVSGAIANYSWNFGDGKSATASSPLHGWSSLGKKQVVFTVKLDNGCTDSLVEVLDVLMQPTADFTADPVCSGDELSFLNKSTTASGTMSYEWEFGDNSSSTAESPKKRYTVKQTTAYNVTLVVRLKDGCADSLTKAVTIQELPRTCDFVASPDYQFAFFGLALEPMDDVQVAGGQAGIDYTWTVAGLGIKNSKDVNAKVNYDLQQDGVYTVTVKSVVRTTGCECSKTKQVVMDRASVNIDDITALQIYPNPTTDRLWVRIPSGLRNAEYRIRNAIGAVVIQGVVTDQSLLTLDLPQLSSGLYTVELLSDQGKKEAKFIVGDQR
ncbi:MAG: PKD domain-containing protein [Bacteroidia bacterium]